MIKKNYRQIKILDRDFSPRHKIIQRDHPGQGLVELALVLPLVVLIIAGIFDLGRAFYAYIAISNAAREGTRVFTFSPKKTTLSNINTAVRAEIGASTVIDSTKLAPIMVECINPATDAMMTVVNDATLRTCKSEEPIRVTLTYTHELILSFFFTQPLTLVRSAEMMIP